MTDDEKLDKVLQELTDVKRELLTVREFQKLILSYIEMTGLENIDRESRVFIRDRLAKLSEATESRIEKIWENYTT
jgi:hypothetical protein